MTIIPDTPRDVLRRQRRDTRQSEAAYLDASFRIVPTHPTPAMIAAADAAPAINAWPSILEAAREAVPPTVRVVYAVMAEAAAREIIDRATADPFGFREELIVEILRKHGAI